jgi:hypothetical protein
MTQLSKYEHLINSKYDDLCKFCKHDNFTGCKKFSVKKCDIIKGVGVVNCEEFKEKK